MITRQATHRLREFLASPAPAAAALVGEPAAGKSVILRQVESQVRDGRSVLRLRGSALPPELLAREMAGAVRRQLDALGGAGPPDGPDAAGDAPPSEGGPWRPLLLALHDLAGSKEPRILLLDDADALLEDRRLVQGLRRWWSGLRAHGVPLHLVLALRRPELSEELVSGDPDVPPLNLAITERTGWFSLREAASCAPGWAPRECVESYALVGGFPPFWSMVDSSTRAGTNMARLLLTPGAPLRRAAWHILASRIAVNARILGVVHALAVGNSTWGNVRRAAGAFRTSSELGPYMKTLQDAGLVDSRRSLDAPPQSRRTRYALRHPLLRFWYGVAHPHLAVLDGLTPAREAWRALLAQSRRDAVSRGLPAVVRQYLECCGQNRFGGAAREAGALWGDDFEIPVAGTLTTGAVLYGTIQWRGRGTAALDRLLVEMRRTRYGFGRENRIPFVVVRDPPSHDLARRIARVDGGTTLTAADLVGRD